MPLEGTTRLDNTADDKDRVVRGLQIDGMTDFLALLCCEIDVCRQHLLLVVWQKSEMWWFLLEPYEEDSGSMGWYQDVLPEAQNFLQSIELPVFSLSASISIGTWALGSLFCLQTSRVLPCGQRTNVNVYGEGEESDMKQGLCYQEYLSMVDPLWYEQVYLLEAARNWYS